MIVVRTRELRDRALKMVADIRPDADSPMQVIVKPYKHKRSLAQNSLYWLWLGIIRDHIRDTQGQVFHVDDVHEWMKGAFLPTRAVQIGDRAVIAARSTARLTVGQFTEYLQAIEAYCVTDLDLVLPRPEDVYHEAMARAA